MFLLISLVNNKSNFYDEKHFSTKTIWGKDTGEFSAEEFSLGEYSAGEFTTGEFDVGEFYKGEFSAGEFSGHQNLY